MKNIFQLKVNEKSDPVLKAVKAVHSVAEGAPSISPEDLKRQRGGQDLLATLVKNPVGTSQVDYRVGKIPCAWAIPDYPHTTKKVILYCHGGGYTCGSLKYAGILAHKLALHCGRNVAFFEYRLAPEHPYPAALKDAVAVWDNLMLYGYGAEDVIVAGDSAGGNMALQLTMYLREKKRKLPGGLVLLSPWTDMTLTSPTYESHKDCDPLITAEYVHVVRDAYAGENADFTNHKLSPLFGDFTGFPKTYIQVGQNEILLHDSTELAERMRQDGVSAKIDIYENGWHVFQQLPMPRALAAVKDIGNWIAAD